MSEPIEITWRQIAVTLPPADSVQLGEAIELHRAGRTFAAVSHLLGHHQWHRLKATFPKIHGRALLASDVTDLLTAALDQWGAPNRKTRRKGRTKRSHR